MIPVHNGGEALRRGLAALAASTRLPDELVVVDDASTDGSGDVARQAGAQVLRLNGAPHGAAYARNRGAEAAQGELLVFLDADVAVHPDTLARIEQTLAEQSELAALFGSYDDDPPAPGLASRYKNLLHHYVHQHGRREAGTFWTGCGAIRRDVFLALGGFDEGCRMMEDIELGGRLRRAGQRVWLCPEIQVTHLKQWTLPGLLRSDILDRAVPWTRLILRDRQLSAELNVDWRGRLGALAAWGLVICLALGLGQPLLWLGALLAVGVLGALNGDLYRFFARRGGLRFALGAAGLHTLYLLYSSLVFGVLAVPALLARYGLVLLLLASLFKGVAWSVVIPPWHAPDEQQHFLYGQRILHLRTLRVARSAWIPQELRYLFDLIQFREVQRLGQPLDLTDRAGIAAQLARLDDPALRWTYVYDENPRLQGIRNFTNFHPPLYYALLAVVQGGLARSSILVRWLACRWLSVTLGLITVALAYRAGRLLWPGRRDLALLLATLVSFQPMVTFSTAIINNGALEITLFSACLVVSLSVIREGLTWRRGLLLGLLVAAGLLTKISGWCLLAQSGLLLGWELWHRRGRGHGWRAWGPWALVALLILLLAGWWYARLVLSGGGSLLQVLPAKADRQPVQLVSFLVHYGWLTIYRSVLEMYWGNFGWLDTPLPPSLLLLLNWVTVIAAWTTGWWLVRRCWGERAGRREHEHTFALFYVLSATGIIIAFYTYLDFRAMRDLGTPFGIQGRYYLPPIIGQMVGLMLGLTDSVPHRLRRAWMALIGIGMVVLNLYTLFRVIAPRYYGSGSLLTLLERATVLQPVSLTALLVLCAGFVILALGLLIALVGNAMMDVEH